MSDTSQGPGWWFASDGKWYPPQSATPPPQNVQPPPPASPGVVYAQIAPSASNDAQKRKRTAIIVGASVVAVIVIAVIIVAATKSSTDSGTGAALASDINSDLVSKHVVSPNTTCPDFSNTSGTQATCQISAGGANFTATATVQNDDSILWRYYGINSLKPHFSASITGFTRTGPTSVKVTFQVNNTGVASGRPSCSIWVWSPQLTASGLYTNTFASVAPLDTATFSAVVQVGNSASNDPASQVSADASKVICLQ